MKEILLRATTSLSLALSCGAAFAGVIPYGTPGTVAPQNAITAAATGDVIGYFVQGGRLSGGGAADTESVRLFDVTTGRMSAYGLNNQTSRAGDTVDFGSVNQGDELVFELFNVNANYLLASEAQYSVDNRNYAYTTDFAGGTLNGAMIPAGVYVGFEDSSVTGGSDLNYRDDQFVFTNVAAASSVTPEPSSFILLGTGALGVLGTLKRRLA